MSQVIINDILPLTQATATGGQTVYSTDWTANYASDVVVYSRPENTPADDATQIVAYPAGYTVAFIGDQLTVQVTLTTPSTAGDVVTITRMTPADRENLYTNTNFTPSMLNNDFGILTLVDQQAQLVNQQVAPRYNYSDFINTNAATEDTILPILPANNAWVKNAENTAIVSYYLPPGGVAPADDTYVLLSPDSGNLPNAFALNSLGQGLLVNVPGTPTLVVTTILGTTNQITVANGSGTGGNVGLAIATNPILPGTGFMGVPTGTTLQRPGSPQDGWFRYNTSFHLLEYYSTPTASWVQVGDNGAVAPGTQNDLAYYALTGNTVSPLTTANNSGLLTNGSGVPAWVTVTGTGAPVLGTSPTITTPNIVTGLNDANGNSMLAFSAQASSVNQIEIQNAITGNSVYLSAFGSDANVPFTIQSKALGPINLSSSAGYGLIAQFQAVATGVNYLILGNAETGNPSYIAAVGSDTNVSLLAEGKGTGGIILATPSGTVPVKFGIASTYVSFSIPTLTTGRTLTYPDANVTLVGGTMLSNALTSADFFVGNGSNVATGVAMSGDASLANTGAVTVSKIGGVSISLAGAFSTIGAHTAAFTFTADSAVTFPTSGTLATTSQIPSGAALTESNDTNVTLTLGGSASTALVNAASITAGWTGTLSLTRGGAGGALTASAGGIVWSDASKLNILAGTSTAGQILLSGNAATPAWSTSTYPSTNAANTLLYASSANTMAALATANSSGLLTNGSGVPSWVTVTGTGAPVLATSPTLVTPNLGAATASSLTFSPTTGGIVGTTTNDNATAGDVGEVVSSSVIYSTVNLSNNTPANVTSISLTAGDWDVWGEVLFEGGGSTITTTTQGCCSRTSATMSSVLTLDVTQMSAYVAFSSPTGTTSNLPIPASIMKLSSTTTVYLVAQANFTVSTMQAGGAIIARRVR